MAWQARLSRPIETGIADARLYAEVDYADSADTATVLHHRTFVWERDVTAAQMQADIIADGQAARSAATRAASLNTSFPAATTVIAIP